MTGTDVWTINSPEWSDRGYAFGASEAGTPFRSSDHDPVIVGISSEIPPVDIDIVTVNDFHGRIEADGAAAGAAVLAGAVQSMRDANPNTIFAANGDSIGASTFTSFIDSDNPTIDALNAAGLEVSSMGNHEFDQGWEDLRDRVQPRADWPYLGANVFLKDTDEHAGEAYFVKEVDGVKVGFIGAITEDLPTLVSPEGLADIDIRDITDSVNAVSRVFSRTAKRATARQTSSCCSSTKAQPPPTPPTSPSTHRWARSWTDSMSASTRSPRRTRTRCTTT